MRTRFALLLLVFVPITLNGGRAADRHGTIAEVYYWKAKSGKLEGYNRYIRKYAEPLDREAQRHGAFISVTTYISQKSHSPWTHMRVFVLRDHKQQEACKRFIGQVFKKAF